MRRGLWKRTGVGAATVLIGLASFAYVHTYIGTNLFPDLHKKHAMIRLEDVGPGGDYGSLDGLGKLRAVFEYLESAKVPFHVAVIPRRMSQEADGTWKEEGIDDPHPDAIVTQFVRLLQDAQSHGGVLGMHGYSHQYGDTARPDGGQNSGTGAEFRVKGEPETSETGYAAERIRDSLAAFAGVGLQPAFWESPHYRDTRQQEAVFRSFVGILFQPDLFSLRSFKDLNAYDTENGYGQSSLGSVYVPAPLRYVGGTNTVDRILSNASHGDGLAALYVHPFLEFSDMERVIGPDGQPAVRDGLPDYRYTAGSDSDLHRLVGGLQQMGYRLMSLYDIVPFSPAHRVTLPPGTAPSDVLLGDVTGGGHADVVIREVHRILLIPGTYTWPRNRPQQAAEVWLKGDFPQVEQALLADLNGDGRADLVLYDPRTGDVRVGWSGDRQFASPVDFGRLTPGLTGLQPLRFAGTVGLIAQEQNRIVLIRHDRTGLAAAGTVSLPPNTAVKVGVFDAAAAASDELLLAPPGGQAPWVLRIGEDGGFLPSEPVRGLGVQPGDQLLVGDPNGDGLTDLIAYRAKTGVWREFENLGNRRFVPLDNDFGPWAQGGGRIGFASDFDGNGKTDIAAYDAKQHVLDLALSFRSRTP